VRDAMLGASTHEGPAHLAALRAFTGPSSSDDTLR